MSSRRPAPAVTRAQSGQLPLILASGLQQGPPAATGDSKWDKVHRRLSEAAGARVAKDAEIKELTEKLDDCDRRLDATAQRLMSSGRDRAYAERELAECNADMDHLREMLRVKTARIDTLGALVNMLRERVDRLQGEDMAQRALRGLRAPP